VGREKNHPHSGSSASRIRHLDATNVVNTAVSAHETTIKIIVRRCSWWDRCKTVDGVFLALLAFFASRSYGTQSSLIAVDAVGVTALEQQKQQQIHHHFDRIRGHPSCHILFLNRGRDCPSPADWNLLSAAGPVPFVVIRTSIQ
jgi:hypothetical protein